MPKTEDGYNVKKDDLVWCVSDPFTITSITLMHRTNNWCKTEFTFWLDPGDGEGDFPASNHEVFQYQRNCLSAARRIAHEKIQCNEACIKIHREEINSINNFLEGMD